MVDVPARGSAINEGQVFSGLRGKVCLFDFISGGCFALFCSGRRDPGLHYMVQATTSLAILLPCLLRTEVKAFPTTRAEAGFPEPVPKTQVQLHPNFTLMPRHESRS